MRFKHFFAEMAKKKYLPGEETPNGDRYEPDREPPDLGDYVYNQWAQHSAGSSGITGATGWILPDGRVVQMGGYQGREQDHRNAVPSTVAMRKWGWPEEIIKSSEEGGGTMAMKEMMRRSRIVRVIVGGSYLLINHETRLSSMQKEVIMDYIKRNKLRSVEFDYAGKIVDLTPEEAEDHLYGGHGS